MIILSFLMLLNSNLLAHQPMYDSVYLSRTAAQCEAKEHLRTLSYVFDFGAFENTVDQNGNQLVSIKITASRTECKRFADRFAPLPYGLYTNDRLELRIGGKRIKAAFTPNPPVQQPDYVERTGWTRVDLSVDKILSDEEKEKIKNGEVFLKKGHAKLCNVSRCTSGYNIFILFPR